MRNSKQLIHVSAAVPLDDVEALRQLKRRRATSFNALMREAVRDFLEKNRTAKTR